MSAVATIELGGRVARAGPRGEEETDAAARRNASSLLPRCLLTDEDAAPFSVGRLQEEPQCTTSSSSSSSSDGSEDEDEDRVLRYMGRTSNAFNPCQTLVWPKPDIIRAARSPGAPALRLFRLEWDVLKVSAIPTVFGCREVLMSPPFHTNSDLDTMWMGLVVVSCLGDSGSSSSSSSTCGSSTLCTGRAQSQSQTTTAAATAAATATTTTTTAKRGKQDEEDCSPKLELLAGSLTPPASSAPTHAFQLEVKITSASECRARLGVRVADVFHGPFVHSFKDAPWTQGVSLGFVQPLVNDDDKLRVIVEVYDADPLGHTAEELRHTTREEFHSVLRSCSPEPTPVARQTAATAVQSGSGSGSCGSSSRAVAACSARGAAAAQPPALGGALAALSAVADCTTAATMSKAIGRALIAVSTEVDLVTGERFLMLLCGVLGAGRQGLPYSFFSGLSHCVDHLRQTSEGLMQLRLLMTTPNTGFANLLTADQQTWVRELLHHQNGGGGGGSGGGSSFAAAPQRLHYFQYRGL